jgi:hypothetical protein
MSLSLSFVVNAYFVAKQLRLMQSLGFTISSCDMAVMITLLGTAPISMGWSATA